ncbi:substrate-binding domain-containing protein [Chloroflexi bacterium TSY]|nr:substrate-binding domain-containing protein [Chloroflexi bacterium TSY]
MNHQGTLSRRQFLKTAAVASGGMVLVACAPVAAPGGSGGEADVSQEAITLQWWTPVGGGSEAIDLALKDKFEAAHDIKLEFTGLPEGAWEEKLTAAIGAGAGGPDVSHWPISDWLPASLDLTEYLENDADLSADMYFENAFNSWCIWRGGVRRLINALGASLLMYNKATYDEMGVDYPAWDITTEAWLDHIPQVADLESKRWGGDRPRGPYRAIYFNYGARPYSDDSKTVDGYLNSPESVMAYQWLWDLVATEATPTPAEIEALSYEGTGPVDLFLAGRIATATLNEAHAARAEREGIEFGVIPEPMVPGNERWIHNWAISHAIWEGTQQPDAAWTFLKYLCSPEGNQHLLEQQGSLPALKSLAEDYVESGSPWRADFVKMLDFPNTYNWILSHPCWRPPVQRSIQDLWDRIMLMEIERDEIEPMLNELVPVAQATLDECYPIHFG